MRPHGGPSLVPVKSCLIFPLGLTGGRRRFPRNSPNACEGRGYCIMAARKVIHLWKGHITGVSDQSGSKSWTPQIKSAWLLHYICFMYLWDHDGTAMSASDLFRVYVFLAYWLYPLSHGSVNTHFYKPSCVCLPFSKIYFFPFFSENRVVAKSFAWCEVIVVFVKMSFSQTLLCEGGIAMLYITKWDVTKDWVNRDLQERKNIHSRGMWGEVLFFTSKCPRGQHAILISWC